MELQRSDGYTNSLFFFGVVDLTYLENILYFESYLRYDDDTRASMSYFLSRFPYNRAAWAQLRRITDPD